MVKEAEADQSILPWGETWDERCDRVGPVVHQITGGGLGANRLVSNLIYFADLNCGFPLSEDRIRVGCERFFPGITKLSSGEQKGEYFDELIRVLRQESSEGEGEVSRLKILRALWTC